MAEKRAKAETKAKPLLRSKSGPFSSSSGEWKDDPRNTPHNIYFYYFHSDDTWTVYQWATPPGEPIPVDVKPGTKLNALIFQLTENAKKSEPDKPRPIGWDFSHVTWTKKSHIVIVLEDGEFTGPALEIKRHKGDRKYENHCFFDGGSGELSDGRGNTVQALWVVNYMKNLSGEDIPPGRIHNFKWKLHTKNGRGRPISEEGSGTNMGPPVPPP